MTVTYTHDHADPNNNPAAPSFDALSAAGVALADGALKAGPLASPHDIMGARLSPSPELHGQTAAVLEIDYADGSTRTWDIDAAGTLTPRRYAFAVALVFESDDPRPPEGWDLALDDVLPADCRSISQAHPVTRRADGGYMVRPVDRWTNPERS